VTQEHPARALFADALAGRIDRRELLQRAAALGLSAPVVAALSQARIQGALASEEGTLTPTFYQWIINNHGPSIDLVDADFVKTHPLDRQIAPVEGFGIERFVAEARDENSTWDVYFGMTPFVEMKALVDAGVIEPWDPYIPQDVLNDIIPAIREEGMLDGKLYNWPFLLDIIVQGWNADIVTRAELDPEAAPKTWDEFLTNARKVMDSGAAPFGATFDAHGWRSLAPITHTISTEVYTPEGLFDFTNDAAVQALEIMKRMMEVSHPDVLNPGTTDGGVNNTPDEGAFAAQRVAYYVKYQNAHLRFAAKWPDPSQLRIAGMPKTEGGAGATVFWDTGAALFKYGKNKELAAEYLRTLTYDDRIWEGAIAGREGQDPGGQVPVYQSIWQRYADNRPAWMKDWAFLVHDQLAVSKAITTHKFGLTQFNIGQPHWEKYLKGEESDPRKALQAAKDAVAAEVAKG